MKRKLENGDLVKTSNLGDLYFVCENDDYAVLEDLNGVTYNVDHGEYWLEGLFEGNV
jgi:hypothetical protein